MYIHILHTMSVTFKHTKVPMCKLRYYFQNRITESPHTSTMYRLGLGMHKTQKLKEEQVKRGNGQKKSVEGQICEIKSQKYM